MLTNKDLSKSRTLSPHLIFVNRFYAPDMSATSQILTGVAEALTDRGHKVCVFTSRNGYNGDQIDPTRETKNGVKVRRVWSTRFGRSSTIGRSIDYLTFFCSVIIALMIHVSRGDVLISKTDPPLLSLPLGLVARSKNAKMVNWLQDVFPEVALELGFGNRLRVAVNGLKLLRNRSIRRADMNVVIGERMAEVLQNLDVPRTRICVIHNFADDQQISSSTTHASSLRQEWGVKQDDFVVGYSGNLGRAHDLDTILDVAERLNSSQEIKFLFIGGGFHHERLMREITQRSLNNVILKPYQLRSRLSESLSLPDIHWASLDPKLEGYIVPSKVYGIAAAGRPLLMIGDPDGEVGRLISSFQFGKCVQPGASEHAMNFILSLKRDDEMRSEMGRRARTYIDQNASFEAAIARWESLSKLLIKP